MPPAGHTSIEEKKRRLREQIWGLLVKEGIAAPPFPIRGRIPNFKGSDMAAKNLDLIPEYSAARLIMIAPDFALFHARVKALTDGKSILMPTPRLKRGFILLEPDPTRGLERKASTIAGAFKYGELVKSPMKSDFVIQGCVAVDRLGNRLGKGGGYGDIEISIAKKLDSNVKIAVICSHRQIIEVVPHSESDEPIDYIVTELGVLRIYS